MTPRHTNRIGLLVMGASLVVIALTLALLFVRQRDNRLDQIRIQGISLARVLSQLPSERLTPETGVQGPLDLVRTTQDDPDFAYACVTDLAGRPLKEVTSPGTTIPAAEVAADPVSWFGERAVRDSGSGRSFRDFYAPILSDGELTGQVRVGYRIPGYTVGNTDVSFFAMLALPIFLLVPLFYFLLNREIRPLRMASDQVTHLLAEQPLTRVELQASGDMGDFVQNFNRLMAGMQGRLKELESRQGTLNATTKVLSYRKARIEAVLQSMPEGVIVLDESGKVTFANKRLATLLDIDDQAILGTTPDEWCRIPEIHAFLTRYHGQVAHRNEQERIEATPPSAPNKRVAVSAFPLFSPRDDSAIYGTLVVFHDVTNESLARKARSDFVAHLSHELKTPLQIMGMYSEMLQGEDGDDRGLRIEAANAIRDQVERVATLTNGMLDVTQMETGSIALQRKRVRLRDLLEDAFQDQSQKARNAGLTLELDLQRDLSALNVDKERLRVVINNLLGNAIKYSTAGGHVLLGAREDEERVRIYVRDTGPGISESDRARVFEKFFRSEDPAVRAKEGHGLGLTLASQIIALHGGELRVDSTAGEGSEFTILLEKTPYLLSETV